MEGQVLLLGSSYSVKNEATGCILILLRLPPTLHVFRNPQRSENWADLNSLTNGRSVRSGSTNNRDGRLNTECEINNRSAANLRSLNIPSTIGTVSQPHMQIHVHPCQATLFN